MSDLIKTVELVELALVHPLYKLYAILLCIVLMCELGVAVLAQAELPPAAISDLAGTPSNYKRGRSVATVQRLREQARRRAELYEQEKQQRHQENIAKQTRAKVFKAAALSAPLRRPVRSSNNVPVSKGVKPPVPVLADMSFQFESAQGEALTNAAVVAAIKEKDKPARTISTTTDQDGRVVLSKVGPFPVVVDWEVKNLPIPDGVTVLELAGKGATADFAVENPSSYVAAPPPIRSASRHLRPVRVAALGRFMPSLVDPTHDAQKVKVIPLTYRSMLNVPNQAEVAFDGEREQSVVASMGVVMVRVPVTELPETVLLFVGLDRAGGHSEAVFPVYQPTATLRPTILQPSAPNLVSLKAVATPEQIDIGASQNTVEQRLGVPGKKHDGKQIQGTISQDPDGAEWWEYTDAGVAIKLRRVFQAMGGGEVDDNLKPPKTRFVERIRLLGASSASIAHVSIGDTSEAVEKTLGPAEVTGEERGLASYAYMHGGLIVRFNKGQVAEVEIARARYLLEHATQAYVPRENPAVYVESFTGQPTLSLKDRTAFADYLRRANFKVVDAKEAANFVVRVSFEKPDEHRGQVLTAAIPVSYSATVTASYDIEQKNDDGTWKSLNTNTIIQRRSSVDYSGELAAITTAVSVAQLIKRESARTAALGALALEISELQRLIKKAAGLGVAQAEASVLASLTGRISQSLDFSARVTQVDYANTRLIINVGAAKGVRVGGGEIPATEFELIVGKTPLYTKEEGMQLEYCTARVVSVEQDSCVCELRHVTQSVKKTKAKYSDVLARDEIKSLPDPATALIAARAIVRLNPLTPLGEAE